MTPETVDTLNKIGGSLSGGGTATGSKSGIQATRIG